MTELKLYNVKLQPKPIARLRAYCTRTGISQGLLLSRFFDGLPKGASKIRKVVVDIRAPAETKAAKKAKPAKKRTVGKKAAKKVAKVKAKAKRKYTRRVKTELEATPTELVLDRDRFLGTINAPTPERQAVPVFDDAEKALLADIESAPPAPVAPDEDPAPVEPEADAEVDHDPAPRPAPEAVAPAQPGENSAVRNSTVSIVPERGTS